MVAVLFARSDSIYKTIPGLDVFDLARDARTYTGDLPVVAHPPAFAHWLIDLARRCGSGT